MLNFNKTRSVIDQIFSHPLYRSLDVNALKRYVFAPQIVEQSYAKINQQTGNSTLPGYGINRIGEGTLFLTQPGAFVLENDVSWTHVAGSYSAIVILSDDVTLDLNGHTITCVNNDPGANLSTISTSGFSNVTIKNGTLKNAYYCGINANETNGLTLENVYIQGMKFQNITAGLAYPAGLHLSNCSGISVDRVRVHDVQVTADTGAGIVMIDCQGGSITNITLGGLYNKNGSMQGLSQFGCEEFSITGAAVFDLSTDSIAGKPSTASTAIGFMPTGCVNLSFTHCEAHDIKGCCDDCHGMSVFLCEGVRVTTFHARNVVDGRPPYNKGAKATGLEVYGVGVVIQDCHVSDIVAHNPEDLQSSGFSVWGLDNKFIGCSASKVSVVGTPPLGQSYYAVGFGWAPDPRPEFRVGDATKVSYLGCSASECGIGFDTFRHVDSNWLEWTASGCAISVLQSPGSSRTITCCPCSECSLPINAQVPNTASGNTFTPPVLQSS